MNAREQILDSLTDRERQIAAAAYELGRESMARQIEPLLVDRSLVGTEQLAIELRMTHELKLDRVAPNESITMIDEHGNFQTVLGIPEHTQEALDLAGRLEGVLEHPELAC